MAKKVLITGANGDTGRAGVRESIALGLDVRAMVHKKDARSEPLEKLGAEVVVGDLLEINTVRVAMNGVDAAYLVAGPTGAYPRDREFRASCEGSGR
jgi:NAD(P)H dehydrogenase (quinone)